MSVLRRIETYLRESRTPATRFGREAVRDPRLVHDLRRGREPGQRIVARIDAFIEQARER